jgi:hypothetical protein
MSNASLPPHFAPFGAFLNCSTRADCIALSGGLQLVSCVSFSDGLPQDAPLGRGVCVCSVLWGRQGAGCDETVDATIALAAIPPLVINLATLGYIALNLYRGLREPDALQINAGMGVIVACGTVAALQSVWHVLFILAWTGVIPGSSTALVPTNSIIVAMSIGAILVSLL